MPSSRTPCLGVNVPHVVRAVARSIMGPVVAEASCGPFDTMIICIMKAGNFICYNINVANMVSACVLMIVEGEGGKERKSLRLNVIIYEPPKKNPNCASLTRVVSGESAGVGEAGREARTPEENTRA